MTPHLETTDSTLIPSVVAIIQQDDRFLFVKRSDYSDVASGYWSPVSGRIEPGESQIAALEREAKEEIGVVAVAVKKLCDIISVDGNFFLSYWRTEIIAGEAQICSHEATELRWVTLEELSELHPKFEEDADIVRRFGRS